MGHMEEVEVTARDKWSYNVSVFSKAGFEDREHTLVISPQGQSGGESSFLAFDYITYE